MHRHTENPGIAVSGEAGVLAAQALRPVQKGPTKVSLRGPVHVKWSW